MQLQIEFLILGLVATMGIFILCFVSSGIKILKEWDRAVVLRLGKFLGIRGPGIIWLTPFLDKAVLTVSLKIQQTIVDTGTYTTSDGSRNRLTGYVGWRIIDVQKAVLAVENYKEAIRKAVHFTIQKVVETFPGDTVFIDEESLYAEIQQELGPSLLDWGVKITEIKLKSASNWD